MIYLPALSLFLYNVLLVNLARGVKRIANDSLQEIDSSGSLWDYLPIVGDYMTGKELPVEQAGEHNEFSKHLLNLNIVINALLLMPFFFKHRRITLVLGLVITWNLFIFERIFAFQLMLIWSLWYSRLTQLSYATIIGFAATMNFIYLKLIYQTMKLQRSCFHITVQRELDGKMDNEEGEEEEEVVEKFVPEPIEGPIGDGST